jgi:hypothetical protein
MTTYGKLLPALLSALVLTACGGGDSSTSNTASNAPDGFDQTPVDNNTVPAISGSPSLSVDEGAAYSFTPAAFDADGDNLSFSIQNLPYWATFNAGTGQLSGTPDFAAAGTYSNLTIRVSDGELSAQLPSFNIVVNNVDQGGSNPQPTLSEMAPTLQSAVVSGSNVVLTWTQDGLTPAGGYDVYVDGVDTNTQYRTTSLTAAISGLDLTAVHCFNVESRYTSSSSFYPSNQVCSQAQAQVEPDNQAPVISGFPSASVVAGVGYSFTPSASDPDDDSLNYSVTNLPSWASFNSNTGAISGTPGESDVGLYSGVSVSVSDGDLSASIGPFSIEVQTGLAETGSLALKWAPPSVRTDGSVLEVSDIDGYCIYLGDTGSSLELEVDINDGVVDGYTFSDLPVGTYFVAVTAYDMEGNQSSVSNTIEVSVSN